MPCNSIKPSDNLISSIFCPVVTDGAQTRACCMLTLAGFDNGRKSFICTQLFETQCYHDMEEVKCVVSNGRCKQPNVPFSFRHSSSTVLASTSKGMRRVCNGWRRRSKCSNLKQSTGNHIPRIMLRLHTPCMQASKQAACIS
jgi:hypothetical protein